MCKKIVQYACNYHVYLLNIDMLSCNKMLTEKPAGVDLLAIRKKLLQTNNPIILARLSLVFLSSCIVRSDLTLP